MRTENSIKNLLLQFTTNIVTIVFLFVSQTIFIKTLGIEYNGLNGLFTSILTILNLFELGIGSSITFNLYKYIKNDDKESIKSIIQYFKISYYVISGIIFGVSLIFIPFLGYIVGDSALHINIYIVYILFVLTTVSSYFLSYKRNLIIANQKSYIINIVQIIFITSMNLSQIMVLILTKNYYLYLFLKIIFTVFENMVINLLANKMYPYLKEKDIRDINLDVKKSIVERVKALFIHKTSYAITSGTDNVLISSFFGISTVGLYTNYNYIISSVKKIFGNIILTTTPSIGNLLIENNYKKNFKTFKRIHFLNYWISVFTSVSILLITQPFIKMWIGETYLLSNAVLFVLTINFFQLMMRSSYIAFKDAGGIWIEDKFVPIFQLSINLVVSIFLAIRIGLIGIFIGTIVCNFTVWFYSYPKYIYKRLFNRNLKQYYCELIYYFLIFLVISFLSYFLNTYFSNIFISVVISLFLPNLILFMIFKHSDEYKYYKKLIKRIVNHRNV